ncbi:MAG: TonB-dependent receptor [Niabella sp.]
MQIKLVAILMLLCTLHTYAGANAQHVTLKGKDLSLVQVLQQIKQQTGYSFFYNNKLIEGAQPLTIDVKNMPLQQALTLCFEHQPFTYRIYSNNIILEPKKVSKVISPFKIADEEYTIRGRVYNTHEPPDGLGEVNISVKGKQTGTTTDADGYFTIRVLKNDVLEFSRVGYQNVEFTVLREEKNLNIAMKEVVTTLNEVVVTGLGEQQKRHMASAVSSINVASNINNKPITTLSQGLQGGVTGIQVTQSSGLPGGDAATIKIRGISTLGNSNPLVLVDGVPMDMNQIDPVTVASVTILKDAAAAAIYGARAANGVIVVTTKRGVPGKVSVTYDGYYGIQKPTSLPETVDAVTYMNMYNEAQINAGNARYYTDSAIARTARGYDPLNYPNTNWVNLMVNKSAPITNHSVSISGGNNVARFAVTGNYIYQKGMIPTNDMSRFNIRANTSITLSKNFLVNLDMLAIKLNYMTPNRTAGNQGNRILEDIYRVPPTTLPKYPSKDDGQDYYGSYVDIVNPLAYAEKGGYIKRENGQASLNLQPKWTVFKGFNLRGQFSYRLNSDVTHTYRDNVNFFDYNTGSLLRSWTTQRSVAQSRTTYYYLAASADYTLRLHDHFIYAMAGYSQEETNSGDWDIYSMISGFAKVNYSFKDKYLAEATLRTDGSSRFAPGHKYGYFPSFAVGWNVHNEKFLRENPVIRTLKLRASYGKLGNENIGLYKYQTVISTTNGVESTYGNPDISWETVNMLDAGFDLSLFKAGKLDVTFDIYNKKTTGIILNPPLPGVGGFQGVVPVNAGKVENKGVEASVNYNDKIGAVNFSVRPGFSYNKNTINTLRGGPYISGSTIQQEGYSINSIYGYKTSGLLQSSDFDASGNALIPILNNEKPGDIKYLDISGPDGKPDGIIDANDQMLIGNPTPRLTYFSNIQASYKNFDLDILAQGSGQSDDVLTGMFAQPLDFSADGGVPTAYYASNYWTTDRTNARYPRISANPTNNKLISDFWFQNAAYLRIKYIQLGYTFNSQWIKNRGISSARLYVNAQNPFTFTSMKFLDPESQGNQWTYSISKAYTVGISIKL